MLRDILQQNFFRGFSPRLFKLLKQIDFIFSVFLFCNRSQKTSLRAKNKKSRHSNSRRGVLFLIVARHDVVCELLPVQMHAKIIIYLLKMARNF